MNMEIRMQALHLLSYTISSALKITECCNYSSPEHLIQYCYQALRSSSLRSSATGSTYKISLNSEHLSGQLTFLFEIFNSFKAHEIVILMTETPYSLDTNATASSR